MINPKYEYGIVEVVQDPVTGTVSIDAPTFRAEVNRPIMEILAALPNMLQEKEKGGWETYAMCTVSGRLILSVRKKSDHVDILIPNGLTLNMR